MNLSALPSIIAQATAKVGQETERATETASAVNDVLLKLPYWITSIVVIVVFFFIARLAARKSAAVIMQKQEEYATLDAHKGVIILAQRLTFFGVIMVGIVMALGISNLLGDLGWLIGSMGLAIGFALQGFIANFVSGIFLLIQDRTKLGNYIEIDALKGTITEIGLRSTVIQTFNGFEVMVPNKMFFDQPVTIYNSNPYRRVEIPIGVDYSTNLNQAIEVILKIIDAQEKILKDHPRSVVVKEFGDSSINLSARFWVVSRSPWWTIKSDVMKQVKEAFDKEGIVIPFPHVTLKVDQKDPAFYDLMEQWEETRGMKEGTNTPQLPSWYGE